MDRYGSDWFKRVGTAVCLLAHYGSPAYSKDKVIWSLSLKAREPSHESWLVVGKAYDDNGFFVAFHDSDSADGAIMGFMERLKRNDLKWHEDKYPPGSEG